MLRKDIDDTPGNQTGEYADTIADVNGVKEREKAKVRKEKAEARERKAEVKVKAK